MPEAEAEETEPEADPDEDVDEGSEPDEPEEEVEEEVEEAIEEAEEKEQQIPDEKLGCKACNVPENDMLVAYDRNMDKPWKGGNPYSRVCPECGNRTFAPKSLFETQDQQYVIKRGENEVQPLYYCPYEDCGEPFAGMPDECPACEREIIWEE